MRTKQRQDVSLLIFLGSLLSGLGAQAPRLVRDFAPGYTLTGGDSDPSGFTLLAGDAYFSATTRALGRELYRLPRGATNPVLVKDIVPGPFSSGPIAFEPFQSQLYFGRGEELWRSDGTASGTVAVASLRQKILQIKAHGPRLLVVTESRELFVSDGTAAGTRAITPKRTQVLPNIVIAGGTAYLVADTPTHRQIWKFDGSGKPRFVTSRLSFPLHLATVGNRLLITNRSGIHSHLWSSDGTDQGTVRLSAQPIQGTSFTLGGLRLFTGFENSAATLFSTDGTVAGTKRIGAFPARTLFGVRGVDAGRLGFFTNLAGGLLVTDGTAAGTKQIFTDYAEFPAVLRADTIIFAGRSATHGIELYVSDGTVAGTTLVQDVHPGPANAGIRELTSLGSGMAIFRGTDPNLGTEVMLTDGTPTGTRTLGEIQPIHRVPHSGVPVVHDESLGVSIVTDQQSARIYLSDSSTLGTAAVLSGALRGTASLGGQNYVLLNSSLSFQLHRVSASGMPSLVVTQPSIAQEGMFRAGRRLIFSTFTLGSSSLWSSDGTASGTAPIRLPGGTELTTSSICSLGDRVVVFGRPSNQPGTKSAYISDGTDAGTIEVLSGIAGPFDAVKLGDRILLSWATGLAISDGTPGGTRKILSPAVPLAGSLVTAGNAVYFQGSDGSRSGLWKTDGTDPGTVKILDGDPASASLPFPLAAVGGQVIFRHETAGTGVELWRTDGTPGVASILLDINPGTLGQDPRLLEISTLVVGDQLYFQASSPLAGAELWVTDGTAAGTRLASDINPGSGSSYPSSLALTNGQILCSAYSPTDGRELFALEVGAHTQQVGFGCAQGPQPRISSTPPVLGRVAELRVRHPSSANRRAMLFLGALASSPAPWLRACALYIDFTQPTNARSVVLDGQGEASFRYSIPNLPALHGSSLCAQAGIESTGSPFGIDLTPGLRMELRR